MNEKIKKINTQLNILGDEILNNKEILKVIMEQQISLEKHFQEIVISDNKLMLPINSSSKIDFVPICEIMYCKANLSYTEIVTLNHNNILSSKSISDFEESLTNCSFFKISKSALVNTKFIHSYNKKNNQILMKNKELLEVARRRRSDFLEMISTT